MLSKRSTTCIVTVLMVLAASLFRVGLAAPAPTKLVMLHHLGTALTSDLKAMMADIEKKLNVEIEMIQTSDVTLVEKALVMAAADILPDIIRIDQQQVRALTLGGLLEDITPYIARDSINLRDFLPAAVDVFTYDGKRYALPAENSSYALFYDKGKFNNAGLAFPTTNWGSNEWLWHDFATAAQRLTMDNNGDGRPDQYGIAGIGHFYFYPWLWGADWLSPDFSTFLGDRPEVISALEKLTALKLELGVQGGSFLSTAAMTLEGSWYLGEQLKKTTVDWDMAAWPKGTQRATVFFPNGFAIGKTSKHKDVAWEVIKQLTVDPTGVRVYTDLVTRVPSHRNLWTYYMEMQERFFPGKAHSVFVDALMYGKYWSLRFATNWSEIDKAIRAQWDRAWRGDISVASAMSQAAPVVNALLKDAKMVKPVQK